ncbi:MAG: ATP synthase subunit I [Acetatifactor sp.]
MIDFLKRRDRILLEMHTGTLLIGVVCQIVGIFFVKDARYYSAGLWFGIALSMVANIHMARTLDIALSDPSRTVKVMVTGYVVRYALLAVMLVLLAQTEVFSPLAAFLGYMSLKLTAYLQPFTHKFYLHVFHETDLRPEDLPCEESPEKFGKTSLEESKQ